MSDEKLTFDQVVSQLKQIGIDYDQVTDWGKKGTETRHQFGLPLLSDIRILMSADEWVNTCSRDGDYYIGGCCGTTGHAQDLLQGVFRDSGLISSDVLSSLAQTMAHHDKDESAKFNFADNPSSEDLLAVSREAYGVMNPWEKMPYLWHLTKDHLSFKVPRKKHPRADLLRESYDEIAKVMSSFSWTMIFDQDRKEEVLEQVKYARSLELAQLYPHLRRVLDACEAIPPIEEKAFALVHLDEPIAIADGRFGPLVFKTQDEAQRILDSWLTTEQEGEENKPDREESPISERFGIHHVTVHPREGIKILGKATSEK